MIGRWTALADWGLNCFGDDDSVMGVAVISDGGQVDGGNPVASVEHPPDWVPQGTVKSAPASR